MAFDPNTLEQTLAAAGVTVESVSTSQTIRAIPTSERADVIAGLPSVTLSEVADTRPDLLIEHKLGSGGMGVVYAARDVALDRVVAVKRLHRDTSSATLAALVEEARITARLDHGNIVPIHYVAIDERRAPVVVMKRVQGTSWAKRASDASGSEDALTKHLETLLQVAQALEFAHSRGIVHRDVKPENVMVGDFGEVYLVDWGLAVRVDEFEPSSEVVGTAAFMAPEMVSAEPIDARTDVYLLGATLHFLLTGSFRHRGDSVLAALTAAVESRAHEYGAEVPVELARICNRACHVDPSQRFQTAASFRSALEDWIARRSAFAMLRGADERTDALEAAIDGLEESAEDDVVRDLFSQTRFGYQQVLEAWPSLEEATHGHDRAVRLMLEHEVGRGDARAARSLLGALHAVTDDDADSVEHLESELASHRENLEARAREGDVETGREGRRTMGLAFVLTTVAVTAVIVAVQGIQVPTPMGLVYIMGAMLALVVAAVWFFRENFEESIFNRHMARLFLVSAFAMLLHRLLALETGVGPEVTMSVDLLFLGAAVGTMAPVSRGAWPAAFACFGGAVLTTFRPDITIEVFAVVVTLLPLAIAADWWWKTRRTA